MTKEERNIFRKS